MSKVQENIALKCVQLTDSNYTQWAILMETILKAYCLWEAIDSTEKVDEKKAHTTKAMIFQTLPGDILMQVAQYECTKRRDKEKQKEEEAHLIYQSDDEPTLL